MRALTGLTQVASVAAMLVALVVETPAQRRQPLDPTLKAHLDLIRCLDAAWRWSDAEPVLVRAITLLDQMAPATGDTTPAPAVDGRLVAGLHVAIPRRIRDAPADYPARAYQEGRSGFVILELQLDDKGNVRTALPARSVPAFDGAATRAAKRWKYAPTMVNGAAVPVTTFAGMRFGAPGESVPSDWIDMAEFHVENGRPALARASLGAALVLLRDDQQRFARLTTIAGADGTLNVTPPVKTRHVNPAYPREAMMARIQGEVHIRAIVDLHGRVSRMSIVSKPSQLDGAAIAAVGQWQFTPATKDGIAVASVLVVTVTFSMR